MTLLKSASIATLGLLTCSLICSESHCESVTPAMQYKDTSRRGVPFAKDPSVIFFQGRYLMYYTLPIPLHKEKDTSEGKGWGIGIAESKDLVHWTKVADLPPQQPVERDGIVAPGAVVIGDQVHLFFQSYGHGPKDAICHAFSADGIHFTHDKSNPVYSPSRMPWSIGRAIDADVFLDKEKHKAYLYFATRDPQMNRQMVGMAEADLPSKFGRGAWRDVSIAGPVLQPDLPWEQLCIEAPSVMKRNGTFYMFYAGAYNNSPQQIGVARSTDGVHWTRISDKPFLPNGPAGSWNSSESGHPGVLNVNGKTYLFFQGNDTKGKTYTLSVVPILWDGDKPIVGDPSLLQ